MSAFNHPLPQVVLTGILERAVRFELTYTGFAVRRLAAWRRAQIGAEGEIRTLDSSLEDSQVSSYRHFRILECAGPAKRRWRPGLGARTTLTDSENRSKAASRCACRALQGWNSWQDSNPQPRRSKRRALPFELLEQ